MQFRNMNGKRLIRSRAVISHPKCFEYLLV